MKFFIYTYIYKFNFCYLNLFYVFIYIYKIVYIYKDNEITYNNKNWILKNILKYNIKYIYIITFREFQIFLIYIIYMYKQ